MITTIRTSLLLTTAIVFLAGYSFIGATWTAPSGTPPNNNTDAPVNIGATTQAKVGNLAANILPLPLKCVLVGTVMLWVTIAMLQNQ